MRRRTGRPATTWRSLALASRDCRSRPSRPEAPAGAAARGPGALDGLDNRRGGGSLAALRASRAGAEGDSKRVGSMNAAGAWATATGGAGATAGAATTARCVSVNRACARPERTAAWTLTVPSPSTRVAHAAGFVSSSSRCRPPPARASISLMASVARGTSSTGSYLSPTLMQGSQSLATANSDTSGRASSRSI